MASLRRRRCGVGTGCRAVRSGVGVAGRWRGPPRVLGCRRQVRRRPASWNRHRCDRWVGDTRSGVGRGHVCRPGADARPHRDHRSRGAQGFAHPSRPAPRQGGRSRGRRRPDRRVRAVRRRRVRRPVRPSRRESRCRRGLHRSTGAASAAECTQPSAGTRGAARTTLSTAGALGASPGRCRAATLRSTGHGARARAGVASRSDPRARDGSHSYHLAGGEGCRRNLHVDLASDCGSEYAARRGARTSAGQGEPRTGRPVRARHRRTEARCASRRRRASHPDHDASQRATRIASCASTRPRTLDAACKIVRARRDGAVARRVDSRGQADDRRSFNSTSARCACLDAAPGLPRCRRRRSWGAQGRS
jgi:hypothetical protein